MNKRSQSFAFLITGQCLVVLVFVVWLLWQMKKPETDEASTSAKEQVSAPSNSSTQEEQTNRFALPSREALSNLPTHPEAQSIGHRNVTPRAEIEALAQILASYSETHGALPTAESNARVMRQLQGANTTKRAWFPREHPRLDATGALLDPYDRPYHFHFESSQQVTLRSAGPDCEFYTEDDMVYQLEKGIDLLPLMINR